MRKIIGPFTVSAIISVFALPAQSLKLYLNQTDTLPVQIPAEGLKVGEILPDINFGETMNYPATSPQKLSDLEGRKLFIFDFWATWCSSCIENWVNIDTLQRRYLGKVQFILVNSKQTGDKRENIQKLLDRWKNKDGEPFCIPTIVNDTVFCKYFAHKLIPHYAWVDPGGKILAYTSSFAVTAENIDNLIAGKPVSFTQKQDLMDYDYRAPLSFSGQNNNSGIKYRSTIAGYQSGLPNAVGIVNINGNTQTRLYCTNGTILQLYKLGYPELNGLRGNQIIYQIKNQDLYTIPLHKEKEWQIKNSFTYELIIPYQDSSNYINYVKQDLDRYFSYTISVDSINVKSLILKTTDPGKVRNNSRLKPASNISEVGATSKFIVNSSIMVLIDYMNFFSPIPVINESHITSMVTLKGLPADLRNIDALNKALKPYGLKFVEEDHRVLMSVIKEGNNQSE